MKQTLFSRWLLFAILSVAGVAYGQNARHYPWPYIQYDSWTTCQEHAPKPTGVVDDIGICLTVCEGSMASYKKTAYKP